MKTLTLGFVAGVAFTGCEAMMSCIARGTVVLTPSGEKHIEDLREGDLVYSIDEKTGELESSPIVHIKSATREVGKLKLPHRTLTLTTDHPVYDPIAQIYAPAGDWLLGKRTTLATYKGQLTTQALTSVQTFVGMSEVFDITVESPLHNFIANGVIVHNKSPSPVEYYPDQFVSGGEIPQEGGSPDDITCLEDVLSTDDPEGICAYVQKQFATEEECAQEGAECEEVSYSSDCGTTYNALCKP